MAENISPAQQQQFDELIGRVFSDKAFAQSLERDPEKALKDAGYTLDQHQLDAVRNRPKTAANVDANVAAFVRPVVSVLTKGTQPAVSVVVSSAVVASSATPREKD